MLLGLHTYSFHLHGMGQRWGASDPASDSVMDIHQLMAFAVEHDLDGLHLTAADCGRTDMDQLTHIRDSAGDKGLYLEYNFSLDEAYDKRLTNTLEEGVAIARALGADIAKVSMDLRRPRPIGASRFHPEIMARLEHLVGLLKSAAPAAEAAGVRIAVENHTDAFSEEVLWVLDRVNHPFVGACVDTVNAIHVTEDPISAVENLAPRAFTNHFRDNRIIILHDGVRFTGAAVGEGDLDMKRAYEIIRDQSSMNRINIELDMDVVSENPAEARRHEREAVVRSIRYCREVLGI
ncbi:MAG: sugar phosphate isomerase/epimerase [Desulfobacterales bacterium]|nr:sugar phosphate isomerase/epimerase [Desulfobacterales bacterium]